MSGRSGSDLIYQPHPTFPQPQTRFAIDYLEDMAIITDELSATRISIATVDIIPNSFAVMLEKATTQGYKATAF